MAAKPKSLQKFSGPGPPSADFVDSVLGPSGFTKGRPGDLLESYSRQARFFAKVYWPEAAKRRFYEFGFGTKRLRKGRPGNCS